MTTAPKRKRPRNNAILYSALGLVLVAVTAGATLMFQPQKSDGPVKDKVLVETAVVEVGDLTEQLRIQGNISYSAEREIGSSLEGIVTKLPEPGSTVGQGKELFRINNEPVLLLHGKLPVWRGFYNGMASGADVQQLEQNLSKLGFFVPKPDNKFTLDTANAVKKWQKSVGLKQSGQIDQGQIIFADGDVRIQAIKANIGDAASSSIVSITSTVKQITTYIETSQRPMAEVGTEVSVQLPGNEIVSGKVTHLGSAVEREGANGPSMKLPLVIELDDPDVAKDFENVSVSISFIRVKVADVLKVPVSALLAETGGGFAVEVVGKKSADSKNDNTLVTVELGAFADGFVEVQGGDLKAGDTVVVAK